MSEENKQTLADAKAALKTLGQFGKQELHKRVAQVKEQVPSFEEKWAKMKEIKARANYNHRIVADDNEGLDNSLVDFLDNAGDPLKESTMSFTDYVASLPELSQFATVKDFAVNDEPLNEVTVYAVPYSPIVVVKLGNEHEDNYFMLRVIDLNRFLTTLGRSQIEKDYHYHAVQRLIPLLLNVDPQNIDNADVQEFIDAVEKEDGVVLYSFILTQNPIKHGELYDDNGVLRNFK